MDLTVDDRQLSSASATATALAQTCAFTEGEIDCGEWHIEHVQASWTATGTPQRGAHHFRVTTRCFVEAFHDQGSLRPAAAVGSIDLVDLGAAVFGQIFDAMLATHSIRHIC